MVKVNDKALRLIGITLIVLIAVYSNKLYTQPLSWELFLRLLLTIGSLVLTWEGNRWIILRFRDTFTGKQGWLKRIAFVVVTGLVYTWLVMIATALGRYVLLYGADTAWHEISSGNLIRNYFPNKLYLSVLYFALFFGIYEALYYYARLKKTEAENKQLEKERLWAQLENLKQQVNPHFLFNTLNSLSELVTEDPQDAEHFLNELSKVYRYLLDNNKHELVTLQTELKFIQSYCQLLKLRFGKGFEVALPAGESFEEYLIPPLTLQLLVENAVKHNTTAKDKPLRVEIFFGEDKRLIVKNNIQRKKTRPLSHKIGLNNISARYQLLERGEVVVQETDHYFVVSLPLISVSPAH